VNTHIKIVCGSRNLLLEQFFVFLWYAFQALLDIILICVTYAKPITNNGYYLRLTKY